VALLHATATESDRAVIELSAEVNSLSLLLLLLLLSSYRPDEVDIDVTNVQSPHNCKQPTQCTVYYSRLLIQNLRYHGMP